MSEFLSASMARHRDEAAAGEIVVDSITVTAAQATVGVPGAVSGRCITSEPGSNLRHRRARGRHVEDQPRDLLPPQRQRRRNLSRVTFGALGPDQLRRATRRWRCSTVLRSGRAPWGASGNDVRRGWDRDGFGGADGRSPARCSWRSSSARARATTTAAISGERVTSTTQGPDRFDLHDRGPARRSGRRSLRGAHRRRRRLHRCGRVRASSKATRSRSTWRPARRRRTRPPAS